MSLCRTKECSGCKQEYSLEEYTVKKGKNEGLPVYQYCSQCRTNTQRKATLRASGVEVSLKEIREYEDVHETGQCQICNKIQENRRLSLDHDHITGKLRGFICHNCNVGLGHFQDDAAILSSAIEYLTLWKERHEED